MRNALFHDIRLYRAAYNMAHSVTIKTPEPPPYWQGILIACVMLAIGILLISCIGKHATR